MTAAQLDLFAVHEAPPVSQVVASAIEEAVFGAEFLGVEELTENDETHVRLVHGDFAFDVRGSFDPFTGREDLILEANGEPVLELPARAVQWVDIRDRKAEEERRAADRAWLLSLCPKQYLNAGPFIRWMRDLYRDKRAHGADLASAFGTFFGNTSGATEYAQFAQGIAFHEAGAFGHGGIAKLIADGATCSTEGHDAALAVLDHALLCGWLEQDKRAPRPWQNTAMYRLSVDSFTYKPTGKEAWRDAPAWLDDIVHFMQPRRSA